MERKRILIVDDEPKILEVVKSYLEKEGYLVCPVDNGLRAIEAFESFKPSLVIIDLMLPDMSGEDICKIIRKKSRIPVIMLTAKIDEVSVLNGFNIGADDYIAKPFSGKELVARVGALLRRTSEEPEMLSNEYGFFDNDLIVDTKSYEVKKKGSPVNLTPSEYKILIALIKYPKKVYTREELLGIAMGEDYDGYDRVIDSHIKNLRQKIETNSKEPKYVITVHGVGYKFGGE